MVASLVCNGEDFGGTLVGAVIDDPVSDTATEGCAAAPGVEIALYWTGALDADSAPGTSCEDNTYTCEGGIVIGIAGHGRQPRRQRPVEPLRRPPLVPRRPRNRGVPRVLSHAKPATTSEVVAGRGHRLGVSATPLLGRRSSQR